VTLRLARGDANEPDALPVATIAAASSSSPTIAAAVSAYRGEQAGGKPYAHCSPSTRRSGRATPSSGCGFTSSPAPIPATPAQRRGEGHAPPPRLAVAGRHGPLNPYAARPFRRPSGYRTFRRNRDGTNDNRSWNCGAEGETSEPDVLALRARQARNLVATLLLSMGTP
jgi:hypothetical protein